MKKTIKLLVLVLSFALLLGTVFAFTVSADEAQTEPINKPWVVSKNVSYEENTHLFLAIDASVAADSTKLSMNVLDDAGEVLAEGLTVSATNQDIYKDGSMIAHVIKTPGVAAKDFADVLTFEVYYDSSAEPVETVTYSVAEYFLERLYKNGIINATTDEDLARKTLYKASLRYGTAAQKVLSPDDKVKVTDLIYVASPKESGIWNSNNYLELPDGVWSVKSYVGEEIVNSVVKGGKYYVENSAIVSMFSKPYEMDESATKVEGFTFAEGETQTPWHYDTANDSVLMGYHNHNTSSAKQDFFVAPVVKEENGEQFINFNKPKGYDSSKEQAAQTSIVWVKNNDTTGSSTLTFETKMRINSVKGNVYFRAYTGRTITGPSSGTAFGSGNGRNVAAKSTSIGDVQLGNKVGEWFTLRFDMSGTTIKIYTSDEFGNMVYRGEVDKSADWAGKDLANATTLILMNDSTATMDIDVAYSYFGAKLPEPEEPKIPELTVPENTSFTFSNKSDKTVSTTTVVKNILDNSDYVEVEKYGTGKQMNLLYQFNSKNTGTSSSAFVLDFDMKWNVPKTAGVSFNSDVIDITLRNEAESRIYRSYIKYNEGNVQIQLVGGNDAFAYENTGIGFGEWFNIKVVYEAPDAAYSADTFKVTYYVNGVEFASSSTLWGTYTPAYDIYNIGILANGNNKSNVQIKNLDMYYVD